MYNATITISGEGVQELNDLNLQITVEAVVQVNAKVARRRATAWLASEVGNMLIAGDPLDLPISTPCAATKSASFPPELPHPKKDKPIMNKSQPPAMSEKTTLTEVQIFALRQAGFS